MLGPTLSVCGLQIGPKLLINAGTLAPTVANWRPKFVGIIFPALGPIKAMKLSIYYCYRPMEKVFLDLSLAS
jgi:hypothetical protein